MAFTIKTKAVDVDESKVYQELLCFSSNSQRDWPSVEKVYVVSRFCSFMKSILLKKSQPSLYLIIFLQINQHIVRNRKFKNDCVCVNAHAYIYRYTFMCAKETCNQWNKKSIRMR